MKKVLSVIVAGLMAASIVPPPASAYQATSNARYYDVQRLQDDLYVLQDSLAALPTTHRRYREFDDRANVLRQDILQMKGDVDGGRTVSRDGRRSPAHADPRSPRRHRHRPQPRLQRPSHRHQPRPSRRHGA